MFLLSQQDKLDNLSSVAESINYSRQRLYMIRFVCLLYCPESPDVLQSRDGCSCSAESIADSAACAGGTTDDASEFSDHVRILWTFLPVLIYCLTFITPCIFIADVKYKYITPITPTVFSIFLFCKRLERANLCCQVLKGRCSS